MSESSSDNILRLLGGKETPLFVNGIKIKSLSLKEIINIGLEYYQMCVANLVSEPTSFGIYDEKVTTYDVVYNGMIYGDTTHQDFLIDALSLFIEDLQFSKEYGIMSGNKVLPRDLYESSFKDIIKLQNGFSAKKEEIPQFASEQARRIYEKIQQGKKELEEKRNSGKIAKMSDLISSLAALSCGGLECVLNLTMYQFYNQLTRKQLIEKYYIGIDQIIGGCDPKNVELEHYTKTID